MTVIFYFVLCAYISFTGFSWWWAFKTAKPSNTTTVFGVTLFWHGVVSIVVLFAFVIWTLAHAAGHIMAHSLIQGW